MTTEIETRCGLAAEDLWSAAETLSPRVQRLLDQFFADEQRLAALQSVHRHMQRGRRPCSLSGRALPHLQGAGCLGLSSGSSLRHQQPAGGQRWRGAAITGEERFRPDDRGESAGMGAR